MLSRPLLPFTDAATATAAVDQSARMDPAQYTFDQLQHQPQSLSSDVSVLPHNDHHHHHHHHHNQQQQQQQHPATYSTSRHQSSPPKPGKPSAPVRRRISRACDQCNQLRTKCDGHHPCAHCIEFGLSCEYIRERKKRGKVSRKDLAAQAAAQAQHSGTSNTNAHPSPTSPNKSVSPVSPTHQTTRRPSRRRRPSTLPDRPHFDNPENLSSGLPLTVACDGLTLDPCTGEMTDVLAYPTGGETKATATATATGMPSSYGDFPYDMQSSPAYSDTFGLRNDSISSYLSTNPAAEWLPIASGSIPLYQNALYPINPPPPLQHCPVLNQLLPHLPSSVSPSLASALLNHYAMGQTHLLTPILRRGSLLHQTAPRVCSLALLASILYISAKSSDAPELGTPADKEEVTTSLLSLTTSFLQPMPPATVVPAGPPEALAPLGTIDDLIAYIHLASCVRGQAAVRRWTVAFMLGLELRLHMPVPSVAVEVAEERRRVWYLLYIMDRHLAFLLNRPLMLPDHLCEGLPRPVPEAEWTSSSFQLSSNPPADAAFNDRGIYTCMDASIFGTILPLMRILGELLHLHHMLLHPQLSSLLQASPQVGLQVQQIGQNLAGYNGSLHGLYTSSVSETQGPPHRVRTIHAYANHMVQLLQVMLTDPVHLRSPAASGDTTKLFSSLLHLSSLDPNLSMIPLFSVYFAFEALILLSGPPTSLTRPLAVYSALLRGVTARQVPSRFARMVGEGLKLGMARMQKGNGAEVERRFREVREGFLAAGRWDRNGVGMGG